MDILRQVALFSVIYLFLISWCMHYFFPKKIVADVNNDLLIFFERRFKILRNISLGLLFLFPPVLGVVVEQLPKEFKASACSVGIIIALSAGFSFAEFRSYLAAIRKQQKVNSEVETKNGGNP